MRCTFKVGFFIVRECAREGAVPCMRCGTLVCNVHQASQVQTQNDLTRVLCLRCDSLNRDDSTYRDSTSSDYTSSSSSNTSDSFSGQGGTFSGAGASDTWDTESPTSAALLGGTPSGDSQGLPPLTSVEAAGLSESDAALFDEVSNFDETDKDRSSFDS